MNLLLLPLLAVTLTSSTSLYGSCEGSQLEPIDETHPYLKLGDSVVSEEQRLMSSLFAEDRQYNPKVPPPTVNKTNGKVQLHLDIEIELELMGVMNVDKDASTITFKAAIRQWWIDPRLTWNKDDFGGVDRLWLSTEDKDCWLPDTIIREDAGGSYFSDLKILKSVSIPMGPTTGVG